MLLTDLAALTDDALAARYAPPAGARPWLRVNMVSSLDGAMTIDGRSAPLSGAADRRVLGLLRMLCDALLVGAGTVRAEGYRAVRLDEPRRAWRRAHGRPEAPTLVVVSARLDLEPTDPVFAAAPVPPIVLTHQAAPADRRAALATVADVLAVGRAVASERSSDAVGGTVDLPAALAELHRRGLRRVLCEGGPQLLGALTAADLVDELCLTLSPLLAGPGAGRITAGPPLADPRRLALRDALTAEGMLFLRYSRPSAG